jgi:carbamoyltransferase
VIANSKLNQRLAKLPDTKNIFIPSVVDASACCVGAAFAAFLEAGQADTLTPSSDVYLGPGYTTEELENALKQEGLLPETPERPEQRIAELLAEGKVLAHFNGRMEYSSRALGNRSILYQANDSDLDEWLNTQLKRPVFLTPRPATLYEYCGQCYQNVQGIEDCLQGMTLSVDCTDFMKECCPVGVQRDGTACPQVVHKEINARFHRILEEYCRLADNPTIINTNLSMGGEPIACTPLDAIRVFKLGHLHYLAMGPFLVKGLL